MRPGMSGCGFSITRRETCDLAAGQVHVRIQRAEFLAIRGQVRALHRDHRRRPGGRSANRAHGRHDASGRARRADSPLSAATARRPRSPSRFSDNRRSPDSPMRPSTCALRFLPRQIGALHVQRGRRVDEVSLEPDTAGPADRQGRRIDLRRCRGRIERARQTRIDRDGAADWRRHQRTTRASEKGLEGRGHATDVRRATGELSTRAPVVGDRRHGQTPVRRQRSPAASCASMRPSSCARNHAPAYRHRRSRHTRRGRRQRRIGVAGGLDDTRGPATPRAPCRTHARRPCTAGRACASPIRRRRC